jgi:hypothetical protein
MQFAAGLPSIRTGEGCRSDSVDDNVSSGVIFEKILKLEE